MQQGTQEWRQARCGKITASRIADIMAKTKSGYAASRKNYLAEMLVERMTDEPTEHFVSREMQWGTDNEPFARELYELERGVTVVEAGFQIHYALPYAGASPDGLIVPGGGVEIKCPNTATHIETLRGRKVSSRYMYQIQFNMDVFGADWWDFVSYDPRIKVPHLQMYIERIERDEAMQQAIRDEIERAEAELQEMYADMMRVLA